jgi:hypothetical protein
VQCGRRSDSERPDDGAELKTANHRNLVKATAAAASPGISQIKL